MNTYKVRVVTYYPATSIEEVVEIEARSPEAAEALVLDGGGYLISEEIEYGDPKDETVVEVKLL